MIDRALAQAIAQIGRELREAFAVDLAHALASERTERRAAAATLAADLDRLVGAVDQVREAVEPAADAAAARVVDALLAGDGFRRAVEAIAGDLVEQVRAPLAVELAAAVAQLAAVQAEVDRLASLARDWRTAEGMAARALVQYAEPAAWSQGGIGYRQRAVVTHRGGTWLALRDTTEPPAAVGSPWLLLADGVDTLDIHAGEAPGTLAIVCRLASGRVSAAEHQLPTWRACGRYSAGELYRRGDVVVDDGCSWLALVDAPDGGPPGDGWQLVAMRGARGRPGPAGPAGETGPRGAPGPRALAPTAGELADHYAEREQ